MFGSLGLPEILVILVLALLIFGPKRLPEVGRTIGKGLAEFRRATTDLKRSVNAELSLEDDERPPTPRRPAQGAGRTASEESTRRELPAAASPDSTASEESASGETGEEPEAGAAARAAEARILESGQTAPAGTTPRTSAAGAALDEAADPPPDQAPDDSGAAEPAASTHTTG